MSQANPGKRESLGPVERWLYIAAVVVLLFVVSLFGVTMFLPVLVGGDPPVYWRSLSNVKQQALALSMYATDFDDRLPPADQWMDASMPYMKTEEIYIDPSLLDPKPGEFGFAFFRPLSGMDTTKISDVEKTPLTFQSKHLSWNASGQLDLLPYRIPQKRGNFASFVDTHAKFMPESWRFETIVIELPEGASSP